MSGTPAPQRLPRATDRVRAGGSDSAPVPRSVQAVATSAQPRSDASPPERRQDERRAPDATRALTAPARSPLDYHWLPRQWPWLPIVMVITACIGTVLAGALPDTSTSLLLTLAVLLVLPVGRVRRLIAERGMAWEIAGGFAVAVLPLGLFGLALARWTEAGGPGWELTVAGIVCVSAVAMAYLRRKPAAMFAAKLAMWASAVMVHGSLVGVLGLAGGTTIALVVSRQQLRRQERDEEFRRAQERVQTRARDILNDYEETGQGWFWETDRRGMLTYISPPVAKALGVAPERLLGHPLTQLFDLTDTSGDGERTLLFHLSARSSFSELSVRAAIEGEERWWSVTGRPVYDQFTNFVGFRGSGTDLTERKRSEEHASRLAHYDSLTGLANRFQMSQTLEKILNSPAESMRACAVMLLDLDRFKQVNDTMGHPAGDALLIQVARRLERAVGEKGKVGRLGGDEFKVIYAERQTRDFLKEKASEIIHSLSQPYTIEGQRVIIGASVGIALAPDHGTTSEELIRNSDLALYAAKDGGRGRSHIYSDDLHAEADARAKLEEDLRDAIVNGELQMYYQPVVSTATNRITGFEALLRWHHPMKGQISPDKFIGIAEDTGLILPIGEWALRQTCEHLAGWPDEVRVAVNVSPHQFANPQLPAIVASAIAQSGIRADRLELELTESVFVADSASTDAMFAALKGIGVRIALDDFGTGYSSLGYLKKAPFDKIKIDQSFVRGATEKGSRLGAIITSITSLAHALGMDTTAEGVETLDELELVKRLGCSHVQGYIYHRPLSYEDACARLAQGLEAVAHGPRSARAPRQTMLRKVLLDHGGQLYHGTIRNISTTGMMIEGLWNVPPGTVFRVQISQDQSITCTTRWSEGEKMGLEFANPLSRNKEGQIAAIQAPPPKIPEALAPKRATG